MWCFPCYEEWQHDAALASYTRREITRSDAHRADLRCIKCDRQLAGLPVRVPRAAAGERTGS